MYRGFTPPTPPASRWINSSSTPITLLGQEPKKGRVKHKESREQAAKSQSSSGCGFLPWSPGAGNRGRETCHALGKRLDWRLTAKPSGRSFRVIVRGQFSVTRCVPVAPPSPESVELSSGQRRRGA